jgi:serine/threonine-protein kinase
LIAILLAAASTIGVGYYVASRPRPPAVQAAGIGTGTATLPSLPAGLDVSVDGVARGTTPIRLTLAPGEHLVSIGSGETTRVLPITIEPGTVVSQYVELPAATRAATGQLEISSDPSGARVRVDGVLRGTTPLTLPNVPVGPRTVVIESGTNLVTRSINVEPGTTATIFSSAAGGATAGWLAIKAPIDLQIFQDARLLGTTATDRLMLPAGRHNLDLVNERFEFRQSVAVEIAPGSTTAAEITTPSGSVSINALPWADVWLGDQPLGATPLANLAVPIGQHEILWRHPELGERRRTIDVTATTPVRIGVDLTQ